MKLFSFLEKKHTIAYELKFDFFKNIKLEENITENAFFGSLSYLLKNYSIGNISALTAQNFIIELIEIINTDIKLPLIKKNRFIMLLFQELENLQKDATDQILILSDIDFNNYILQKLKLKNIVFIGCVFNNTDLTSSLFIECQFRGCSFAEAGLTNTKFIKTMFLGCDFNNAVLEKSKGIKF